MLRKRLRVGVVRYASVANEIAAALGVQPPPEVVVGRRIRIVFRSIGAARWPEDRQVDYALHVAEIARGILAEDARRHIRRRIGGSAIVIVFEDATLRRGCSIVSRWEAVVPVQVA